MPQEAQILCGLHGSTLIADNISATTFDPIAGELEWRTDYYWAVDIVGGSGGEGDLWSFRTESQIVDANMTIWYKLDETSGDDAYDFSGYGNDGDVDDEAWSPADGQFGGSLAFDGDTNIEVPRDATAALGSGVSISCWLKNASQPADDRDDNWVFGLGDGDYEVRAAVPLGDGGTVEWRAGNDSNDVLRWDMFQAGIDPSTLSGWHHWVFVKDEDAGEMKIYLDTVLVDSNDVVDGTLTNLRRKWFRVGGASGQNSEFIGKIDDFRFFIKPLTDKEVESLFRGGELEIAYSPSPFTGAKDVLRDAELTWKPGDFTVEHDVYFGVDLDAVTNATTDVPMGVYRGSSTLGNESYVPISDLTLGTTYYWRIDEVNDACAASPWKGKIWSFSTANFILIDDFESYDDISNFIYYTWIEDDASAYHDLAIYPFYPVAPGGEQSLWFEYNNSYGSASDKYYSEIGKALDGMDFTQAGVKALTVFFYGQSFNDAGSTEDPYMGIDDGTTYAESHYTETGNPISDIQEEEWHEWNVPISDLDAVTLTDVQNIYIGIGIRGNTVPGGGGEVFFDNVRLYPPKCVPSLGPDYDWSGDCIVNLADIGVMANDWLRTDFLLAVQAPTEPPVAHWELDDWFWQIEDSVGTNDGIAEGEYSWVTGKVGDCLEFTGDGGRVRVPNSSALMLQDEASVTAWIRATDSVDYSARVVAKGEDEDDWEAYYIQFDGEERVSWTIRDPNQENQPDDGLQSDDLSLNEWIHVAGTYNGDVSALYVNGQVVAQDTIGDIGGILQDTNDLSIGNASDVNDRAFIGMIDDVRIYNYGLTALEVAYIATGPSGYIGLDSQVNIYDAEDQGEQAINFLDLAKLMTAWMEEKLWPE
jgi:hypothetical protein